MWCTTLCRCRRSKGQQRVAPRQTEQAARRRGPATARARREADRRGGREERAARRDVRRESPRERVPEPRAERVPPRAARRARAGEPGRRDLREEQAAARRDARPDREPEPGVRRELAARRGREVPLGERAPRDAQERDREPVAAQEPPAAHARDPPAAREPRAARDARGDDRNRTGVHGFAGRCVATPPRRPEGHSLVDGRAPPPATVTSPSPPTRC
jgi:hypothetical protein